MLKKFRPSELSEFKKNVAVIFSGSVASQFVLIAVTPWLSRLYAPEQYGLFGLFLSVALITGAVSSFRYTTAIQITEKQEDAERLMQFCRVSVVAVSLLIFLILAIGYSYFIFLLKAQDLGFYIFLLPLATLLAGLIETYSIWLNRNKSFKSLSYNRILISLITVLMTISWAYLVDTTFRGLLVGLLTAQAIGAVFMHFQSRKFIRSKILFDWTGVKPLLRAHKKFLVYSLPADLINVFTNQLPVFMLNRFAGSAQVGYFNMSNRILGLPSVFVSTAVGEVFRQRATEDYHKNGTCRPIFLKTFKTLALIGFVPFLTVALFGPWLFSLILGAQWEMAGEYSRILSLMFFLRFVNSPLSYILYITGKQQYDILGVLVYSVLTIIVFWLGFMYLDAASVLMLYVIGFTPVYLAMFALNYKLSSYEDK